MCFDDETLNALIARIYDAALDDSLWPQLIQDLARLVNAADSFLFATPGTGVSRPFVLSPPVNVDHAFWNTYESHYWQHDVWRNGAIEQGLSHRGDFFHGDQFIDRVSFRQTEIYNDFFKPLANGIGAVMSVVLAEPSSEELPRIVLSFYRSAFAETFTAGDEGLIHRLLPHFHRALRIRSQISEERQMCELREQALDQIASAVVLLDLTGRILFANRKAESLLRRGGNPTVKNGCICAQNATDNSAIKQALREAQKGFATTLRLDNAPPVGTRVATFSPLLATRGEHFGTPARVLVIVSEPDKPAPGSLDAFARLYGLTAAETRALTHLLQQHSTREIAETLQVSMTTLRTQLSALFAKTSTNNQRELIKFCLSHPMIGGY